MEIYKYSIFSNESYNHSEENFFIIPDKADLGNYVPLSPDAVSSDDALRDYTDYLNHFDLEITGILEKIIKKSKNWFQR